MYSRQMDVDENLIGFTRNKQKNDHVKNSLLSFCTTVAHVVISMRCFLSELRPRNGTAARGP